MKDLQQKLLATFEIEHRDHVEQIRALMGMIEKTATQPAGPELDEAFRRAHSLKGAARAVELGSIEGLAHRLETLFSRVRQGECALEKDVVGVVQQVLDASEDCMASLAGNKPSASAAAALRAIERVLGMEQTSAPAEPGPEPQPSVPAFQPLEVVRISTQNFDGLFRSAGGLVVESQRQDQVTEALNLMARDMAVIEKEAARARRLVTSAQDRPESHGEVSRLTSCLDSMERNLRRLSHQATTVRRLHRRSSWTMSQLGNQLQRDIAQARMVPAEGLLEGFRKMVRDLALAEGKEIGLQATSASVHADRRVLEALKDPLMHLLRNAISHGIETPAERAAKKKAPAGVLTMRIDATAQRLTVLVEDDGRGVDLARVAQVAAKQGILSEAAAEHSSEQELIRLLFLPGFSTSKAVTNLSGRGMGLSVVYEAIRRLQGDLDVRPVPGGGTSVLLSVPLSIASHRLVLVNCGNDIFAIPILGIERFQRIQLSSIERTEGKPIIVLDRQPVPVGSIHSLLGLPQSSLDTGLGTAQIVILRSGSQRIAVVVDSILKETDAVIQDLGPAAGCGGRISSGVVLENGAIAFVVNPMELIQSAAQSRVHLQALSFAKRSEPELNPESYPILVVDDSMTTRTLEKSILEAHGYQVRIAVDGVDALARLHREKAALVIADIEMPRLNGFGLIEAMKKDPELKRIPVIIVSSVERREDQERGLALGADAYIVKRKFDQEELLAAIRQIVGVNHYA